MPDILLIEGQGTGCFPDPIDNRDRQYDHLTYGSAPFDWEKGYDIEKELGFSIPPNDQGARLSCVGEATSKYAFVLNCLETSEHRHIARFMRNLNMSARSIYALIHLPNGGAYIRDAFKVLVKRGVNFEATVPSVGGEAQIRDKSFLTPQNDAEASVFKGKEYRTIINTDDVDLVAKAIEEGYGVVVGFDVENNGTWRTVRPRVPNYRQTGHAMYLGKAMLNSKGQKEIWGLNSWGDDTGQDGWQAFGEDWFKGKHISNAWVVMDKPNSLIARLLDNDGKPRRFSKYMIRLLLAIQ